MQAIKKIPTMLAAIALSSLPGAQAQLINFFDADLSNTRIDGVAPAIGTNVTSPDRLATDNLWSFDTDDNWANPNPTDGAIWATNNLENTGELSTTITGLAPNQEFLVYCFGWTQATGWDISAGFTSGALTTFTGTTAPTYTPIGAPLNDTLGPDDTVTTTTATIRGVEKTFVVPLEISEGNRDIYACELGTVTTNSNGEITVYVGAPSGGGRTWYDGIGLESIAPTPTVFAQPQSTDAVLGSDVTFTANIASISDVTYQWQSDGVDIAGATQQSYTISEVLPSDAAASYTLIATNAAGSVTSSAVGISNLILPAVAPASQVVFATFDAEFSITMPDGPAYTYSWSGPAGAIAGANGNSITLSGVDTADSGSYTVAVGLAGETLSATGELIVPSPSTDTYTNTVVADGPIAYWRFGEVGDVETPLDEIDPQYELFIGDDVLREQEGALPRDPNTALRFVGTEDSFIEGTDGLEADLNPVVFTIEAWARPDGGAGRRMIIGSRNVKVDEPAGIFGYELGINADGQWEFRTGQGETNEWNTVTGSEAVEDVWVHLVATYDGSVMELYVNGSSSGTVAADTFAPQTDFEIRVGAGASEQTPAQELFVGSIDELAFYSRALSAAEALNHFVSSVDFTAPPEIVDAPLDLGVLIGESGTLRVGVRSGVVPSYQWRRNGSDLAGETGPELVFNDVSIDDGDDYDVVISSANGTVTSDTVTLIALSDYFGTFVNPDATNTVLSQSGSAEWFGPNEQATDDNGQWRQRTTFAIQSGISDFAYQVGPATEGATDGSIQLETTISGLQPGGSYAVWALLSDKEGFTIGIKTGFAGDPIREIFVEDTIDTGLTTPSTDDPWNIRHALVGVKEADSSGEIAVNVDYLDGVLNFVTRTVYNGLGYQLVNPPAAPPLISINPADQTARLGSDITFSSAASSPLALSFQWQKDDVDIAGATETTYTVSGVSGADAGQYRVIATNSEGSTISDSAFLIPLSDFVGNFVFPDPGNTTLIRDGSMVFSSADGSTAIDTGVWTEVPELGVPGEAGSPFGYSAVGGNEGSGDVAISTTISGLDPALPYAVWVLYAYTPDSLGDRISSGFVGENFQSFDTSALNTGLTTGGSNQFDVYHGLLGVMIPDSDGNIAVKTDYEGGIRSSLLGYGYQTAELPTDLNLILRDVGDQIRLIYPVGTLEMSSDLGDTDPWTTVPGAFSPFDVQKADPKMFFRITE